LRVSGHLYNASALLVLGDLDADTFNDADPGLDLVVLGKARMRWANVYGAATVGRDWQLDEVLFGIDHSSRIRVGGT
jgi:hypothetical protein